MTALTHFSVTVHSIEVRCPTAITFADASPAIHTKWRTTQASSTPKGGNGMITHIWHHEPTTFSVELCEYLDGATLNPVLNSGVRCILIFTIDFFNSILR